MLVRSREPAVTDYISDQNRRDLSGLGHSFGSLREAFTPRIGLTPSPLPSYLAGSGVVAVINRFAWRRSFSYWATDLSPAHDHKHMKINNRSMQVGYIVEQLLTDPSEQRFNNDGGHQNKGAASRGGDARDTSGTT